MDDAITVVIRNRDPFMSWLIWGGFSCLSYWGYIQFSKRRQLSQPIYDDSPTTHQAKVGTPTMGGLILFLSFLSGLFIAGQWSPMVFWVAITTGMFWLIGLVDDSLALIKKNNKGLTAKSKFLWQLFAASLCVFLLYKWLLPIPIWLVGVYIFLITGASNATNLTDGLDGLLGSTMLVSLAGVYLLFESKWMLEEQTMVIIMMASISFFLVFNWYPAKLFMGDVGSLMLGAFLASAVIASGEWPMLIGFGAIYVIETLSVMLQVLWFKLYKTRIFLMSPIHHHFELLGMKEVPVVILFVVIQAILTWVQLL